MAKKKFADVFTPFIEETMSAFGYLVREFGFEHFDTSIVSYECSVSFRKDTVVIFSQGHRRRRASVLRSGSSALADAVRSLWEGDERSRLGLRPAAPLPGTAA
jgi:hypothetical protein